MYAVIYEYEGYNGGERVRGPYLVRQRALKASERIGKQPGNRNARIAVMTRRSGR